MQRYRDLLRGALELGDKDHLSAVVVDLELEQMASEKFDDNLFAVILGYLEEVEFLRHALNWVVLRIFDVGWVDLSAEQRAQLLIAIERSFPKFSNWMGRFSLADFVGRYYCAQDGLDAFERLLDVGNAECRATITPGLAQVVKCSDQEVHKHKALTLLKDLQHDEDKEVRDCASFELGVLKRHYHRC